MEGERECLLPEKREHILPLDNHSVTQETLPLASDTSTFCSAIIAFLGSGVLGFPYAFKETGIVLGLVLLTFVAFITGFCMLLLVECKYKIQSKYNVTLTTYGDIGLFLMGTTGEWLVKVSLVISQAGFTVGYLLFIAANVHAYREDLSKPMIVAYCAPLLILFCLLKHIKQLSYVALVADLMNFTGLSMVYVMDFTYMDLSGSSPVWGGVWTSLPFFLGVSTYCFAGIGMALPLENAMEHKHHFKTILVRTILLLECVYASFGICGYLAFGNETQDVVTLNIKGPGTIATSIKLFLCVGLLCSCPLMLFPVFETLQGSFFPNQQLSISKNFLFRTIVVMIVATIAGGAPHFGTFIALIGSTCCSFLGFVLPVLFHYQLFKDSCSKRYTFIVVFITVVGMAMVGSGLYTTI